MTFFIRALKVNFTQPVHIIVILLLPLLCLFVPVGQSIYGMVILFSAFLLCKPIVEDRTSGIVLRISSTPVRYISYLSSYLLAYALILFFQNIIYILGLVILGGVRGEAILYLFILYFFFNLMSIAFCLFWNSLFTSYNISFAAFSGVGSVMCLVSGISIPLSLYPEKMQNFMMALPTYWLPYGLEAIENGRMGSIWISSLILFIFSWIFLLIGSKRRF